MKLIYHQGQKASKSKVYNPCHFRNFLFIPFPICTAVPKEVIRKCGQCLKSYKTGLRSSCWGAWTRAEVQSSTAAADPKYPDQSSLAPLSFTTWLLTSLLTRPLQNSSWVSEFQEHSKQLNIWCTLRVETISANDAR